MAQGIEDVELTSGADVRTTVEEAAAETATTLEDAAAASAAVESVTFPVMYKSVP
jgi:hypothetical protein